MLNFVSRTLGNSISLLVVSLVMFLSFGGLFYIDGEVKKSAHQLQTLTINAERILNADKSSTTAVRLAASLQSDRYTINYQEFQDAKYALLQEISQYKQSAKVHTLFSKMEDVQQDIEDAEAEAISLIDDEEWGKALELVTEPAFRRQKGIYRANLSSALREMILDSEIKTKQSNRLASIAQYSVLLMFLFLAFIGLMYSREMRRARDELEQRVKDRTEDLSQTLSEQEAVMSAIDYGIIFMDADLKTRLINQAGRDLWGYDEDFVASHPTMSEIIYYNRYNNIYPVADEMFDAYVEDRTAKVRAGVIPPTIVERADGVILRFQSTVLPDGGRMMTYLDVTKTVQDERELKDAFNVISSSINYASRIQRSILPDDNILKVVAQDHFVLWKPRDVVGGDIYWHGSWGDGCLIILGDCTGHGVPGAFMTLISIGALERAMSEIEGGNVSELIARMHQYIQVSLSQHYEGGDSDDGIELGACYCVPEEFEMTFVGARFELIVNDGKEISIVKGTKKGMGYRGIPYDQEYEQKTVDLKSGQSFYMTTDGLVDQVGGDRKRMYGKRRFKELLLTIQDQPMSEQKELIYQSLLGYQGDEKRRDDVSVIGYKL